jgi:hypothetical protein
MVCVQRPRRSSRGGLRVGALCAVISLAGLAACSSSLPRPPTGRVPTDALIEVPYPPPAAHVETIPPQKDSHEVWIDGQWEWDGKEWKWVAGTWMTPPANAYFTPWTTVRRRDGRLFFASAAWRAKDGRPLEVGVGRDVCAPVPVAPGKPVTPPTGEVAKR